LAPGKNTFALKSPEGDYSLIVKREAPPPPISPHLFTIDANSAQPQDDQGVEPGDLISFGVRATPNSHLTVNFAQHCLLLHANANSDRYVGIYRVSNDDHWQNIQPKFTLAKNGKTVSLVAAGHLTVVRQPLLAVTNSAPTVVRLGPGLARTTPLTKDILLQIDGWKKDEMRCLYCSNHHVWINKSELSFAGNEEKTSKTNIGSPSSTASTINIQEDSYGEMVNIPLSQKLPYQVEQHLKPNELVLRLYGVVSDTDWIIPSSTNRNQIIDHITWRQLNDETYEITTHINGHQQWGYWVEYQGNNCVLHLKRHPNVLEQSDSLKNLIVCVDPGHGGNETGSIGCSGLKESDLNLSIALKLRKLLLDHGANVIMTRTSDIDVSLADRVKTAIDNHCDILLSIHNNALPDGGDPIKEHGTSSFWYHPQSIELARFLKDSVIEKIGFTDRGARYQNLALARPSEMLAVLVEAGFMINPDEFAQLLEPSVQQKIADGLFDGLNKYVHQ
jgi:N-acetylmuramoyl-L-alanine amidase